MQGWGAGEPPSTDMPYTAEEIVDGGAVVKSRALYILFLLMGIAPIFLFALVIFWEKHWNKQRQADVEQDINASKVVEPLREGHLMDLMKNYTMVRTKSMEFRKERAFAINSLLPPILTDHSSCF